MNNKRCVWGIWDLEARADILLFDVHAIKPVLSLIEGEPEDINIL